MHSRQQKILRKTGYNYLFYTPRSYELRGKWPLIVFLHGAGEKGNDLELLKRNALPGKLEQLEDFPFIVISPQCPRGSYWSAGLLFDLLDEVEKEHRVDRDRIYATGVSMGGYGVWDMAGLQPWRFAAAAPICGGGNPMLAEKLKRLPIWVFHGAMDEIVPLSESESMVNALRAVGGEIRFTVYPDSGHDSWTRTYERTDIYEWLLSHSRKPCEECPEAYRESSPEERQAV